MDAETPRAAAWMTPRLTVEQLDAMHAAAVRIIEETGFEVEHEALRQEALRHAGISERGGRLCVAAALVDNWLRRARASAGARDADSADGARPCTVEVWDRALLIAVRDNQTLRPMTREDVVWGTKLIGAVGHRGATGAACGVPRDVPGPLQPLEQFMIGAEHSPAGGSTYQITDIPTAEIVREMDRAYGRPHRRSVWLPSPLRIGGPEMDIVWHLRHDVEFVGVGTMPVMGITGPCDPLSVYTLAVAETVGAAVMLDAVLPDVPVGICPHPQPADMTTGSLMFGSPEWQILDLMHPDVFRYYGQDWSRKDILTSAAVPGWQAQVDRMMGLLLGLANGYRHFAAAGALAVDEVWSPGQLLLDLDLLEQAQRTGRPLASAKRLTPEELPAVVQEAVGDPALFAVQPSTLRNLRSEYPLDGLCARPTRAAVESRIASDALADAWREADRLVAAYDHEPPQDLIRELRGIYRRGAERLAAH